MYFPARKFPLVVLSFASLALFPAGAMGQMPQSVGGSLSVIVQGTDGSPLDQMAQVELTNSAGQLYQQATTRGGRAEFTSVGPGSFVVSIMAAGYLRANEQIQLLPGEASIFGLPLVSAGSLASLKPTSTPSRFITGNRLPATIAVIVTFVGSAAAIRRAVRLDPVFALRGEL